MATAYAVPDVLGGDVLLGQSLTKSGALAELVRVGLPVKALLLLAERLDLNQSEIAEKIGIPLRTLTRRMSSDSRLTPAESDRTVRLAQVYATAVETLGDGERAAEWLKTPNRALRGGRPLDQLDTDPGVREVESVLGRIAYGVYSQRRERNAYGLSSQRKAYRDESLERMKIWRLCREIYAADSFSGEGSRIYGGRWNSPGVPMVYASSSLALAAIELFVHVEPRLMPRDLVSISAELPPGEPSLHWEGDALPPEWWTDEMRPMQRMGDAWIRGKSSLAVLAPSVPIRQEWNVLVNPLHPLIAEVKVEPAVPFRFDERMFAVR